MADPITVFPIPATRVSEYPVTLVASDSDVFHIVIAGVANKTISYANLKSELNTDLAFIRQDGSNALTANWDAGSFKITAQTLESDVSTGTAPIIVASTTVCSNLNADLLDGLEGDAYAKVAGDSYTGAHDFGGADSVELPNSAAPTVNAAGEIALDTSITDHTALWKYHDGSTEFVIPAIRTADLTTTNDHGIFYNATTNRFEMKLGSGGGSGAPTDAAYVTIGTNGTLTGERSLTGTTNRITITDNGANSTVVLSTPQNIHTAADVQFGSASLEKAGLPFDAQNSTDAATNQVGVFRGGNRATAMDNDEAYLTLTLDDDLGAQSEYARLTWIAVDVTNTTKDGRIDFDVQVASTLTNTFSVTGSGATVTGDLAVTGDVTSGTWEADTIAIDKGGTGQTTATEGFDALAPTTTLGDLIYSDGSDNVRLAGNTTATKNFLIQTGDGANSAAPAWGTIATTDVPDGSDATAIHDDTSGEINAITEKGSPVNGDWLLIEDSAASNAKKKIQIGNLPSAGGAPTSSQYVTIGNDGTLTGERALTGTANQITVTDNGANSTVVLSTPQDLDTAANVTFESLGLVRANASNATLSVQNSDVATSALCAQFLGPNPGTPAAGDEGQISFRLKFTGGGQDEFARLTYQANDVGSSTKDGELRFGVMVNNVLTDTLTIDETGVSTVADLSVGNDLSVTGSVTSGTWAGTTIGISAGGTGQTTQTAAFDALAPTTTLGDIIYSDGSDNVRLAGNTTTTKNFLVQTGDGANSAAPAWSAFSAGDVPDGADATAIHDDTAGEINAITEKASPVNADLIIIEDSADSNNKKKVQVGNLPGAGGAPTSSPYVTIGNDGTLTAERALTGTTDQITITDNGANSTVVLSTPQDIATTSEVTFAKTTVSKAGVPLSAQNTSDAPSVQVGLFRGGNRATAADSDEAFFSLTLDDDLGVQNEFARFVWRATDVTNTSKDGAISLSIQVANSLTEVFVMDSTGLTVTGDFAPTGSITSGTWAGNTIGISAGGTGQTTATEAFDALAPTTTLGDTIYSDGSDNVRLAGNTTTTKNFLTQTGDGANSAAPAWGTIATGDVPDGADATAIHDNTAGEINAVSEKVSPVNADLILIEDSADSNNKKKIQVGNLPSAGGAPTGASYVLISNDGTLTADRALTGTSNQITITDNGANSSVVLSTPQDLASTSSVQFGAATLQGAAQALDVQNTSDAASNQVATFSSGNRATPADGDEGYFTLTCDNDLGNQQEFARITWEANDVTNTTKDGELRFAVMVNNTLTTVLQLDETTTTITGSANITGALTTGGLNVVEDTTPQLGGMLDINGNAIGDGTLELIKFVEAGSAVNELTVTNAATGSSPKLSATGDDTNVALTLAGKGTGKVINASATEFNTTAGFDTTVDNGTKTGAFTIDWTSGNQQKVTINAAGPLTVTFTAPASHAVLRLRIEQGSTPGTLTWPAAVKWPSGTAPTLSSANGDYDWLVWIYDGTNYDGGTFGLDFS